MKNSTRKSRILLKSLGTAAIVTACGASTMLGGTSAMAAEKAQAGSGTWFNFNTYTIHNNTGQQIYLKNISQGEDSVAGCTFSQGFGEGTNVVDNPPAEIQAIPNGGKGTFTIPSRLLNGCTDDATHLSYETADGKGWADVKAATLLKWSSLNPSFWYGNSKTWQRGAQGTTTQPTVLGGVTTFELPPITQ